MALVMGVSEVPEVLWGAETAKAVENFQISGEPMPAPVIRWLGLIKAAAADVNA
jgi:fumarate hydratase class II